MLLDGEVYEGQKTLTKTVRPSFLKSQPQRNKHTNDFLFLQDECPEDFSDSMTRSSPVDRKKSVASSIIRKSSSPSFSSPVDATADVTRPHDEGVNEFYDALHFVNRNRVGADILLHQQPRMSYSPNPATMRRLSQLITGEAYHADQSTPDVDTDAFHSGGINTSTTMTDGVRPLPRSSSSAMLPEIQSISPSSFVARRASLGSRSSNEVQAPTRDILNSLDMQIPPLASHIKAKSAIQQASRLTAERSASSNEHGYFSHSLSSKKAPTHAHEISSPFTSSIAPSSPTSTSTSISLSSSTSSLSPSFAKAGGVKLQSISSSLEPSMKVASMETTETEETATKVMTSLSIHHNTTSKLSSKVGSRQLARLANTGGAVARSKSVFLPHEVIPLPHTSTTRPSRSRLSVPSLPSTVNLLQPTTMTSADTITATATATATPASLATAATTGKATGNSRKNSSNGSRKMMSDMDPRQSSFNSSIGTTSADSTLPLNKNNTHNSRHYLTSLPSSSGYTEQPQQEPPQRTNGVTGVTVKGTTTSKNKLENVVSLSYAESMSL